MEIINEDFWWNKNFPPGTFPRVVGLPELSPTNPFAFVVITECYSKFRFSPHYLAAVTVPVSKLSTNTGLIGEIRECSTLEELDRLAMQAYYENEEERTAYINRFD
jgi:hypothetical protein